MTDPGREPDEDGGITVGNLLPGNWRCRIDAVYYGDWGRRVKSLSIRHEDYPRRRAGERVGSVAVDSGQCGFFDYDYFVEHQGDNDWNNPESWYLKVSRQTMDGSLWGTLDGKCAVSQSGLGDGYYDVLVSRNSKGLIVGLKLRYL